MTHVHAKNSPVWDHDGWKMTGLASPARGAKEVTTWHVVMQAGADGPLHKVDRELVVNVLEGTVRVTVEGVDYDIPAGDAFIIPANSKRSVSNPFKERATSLNAVPAEVHVERLDGIPSNAPWLK
jgi:quercetin dioxygenase-like cupin family protein